MEINAITVTWNIYALYWTLYEYNYIFIIKIACIPLTHAYIHFLKSIWTITGTWPYKYQEQFVNIAIITTILGVTISSKVSGPFKNIGALLIFIGSIQINIIITAAITYLRQIFKRPMRYIDECNIKTIGITFTAIGNSYLIYALCFKTDPIGIVCMPLISFYTCFYLYVRKDMLENTDKHYFIGTAASNLITAIGGVFIFPYMSLPYICSLMLVYAANTVIVKNIMSMI